MRGQRPLHVDGLHVDTTKSVNASANHGARRAQMTDFIYCLARKGKINLGVCTVESFRHPHKCGTCPLAPKGGTQ
jgi:hypothetical protein